MNFKNRAQVALEYLAARLSERDTWQGIGFVVGLVVGKGSANLDWGQAAGLGGVVSALLKMVFPTPAAK